MAWIRNISFSAHNYNIRFEKSSHACYFFIKSTSVNCYALACCIIDTAMTSLLGVPHEAMVTPDRMPSLV